MVRLGLMLAGVIMVLQPMSTVDRLTGCCEQNCPDDEQDGQCPPDCIACACSGVLIPLIPNITAFSPPLPTPLRTSPLSSDDLPQSADPGELLHVPKLLHA